MEKAGMQSQVEGAKAYEALMVPAVMGAWAPRVADAAELRAGQRVLDVACGTGVLAREAAARGAVVTGVDPNAGMLEVAAQLEPRITWRRGLAESLPFPDGSFDAVVSQFGVMFWSDPREGLREAFRVLAPGGRLAVAVWAALETMPAYKRETELLERLAGQAAGDALRAPFVLGDRAALDALLRDAGIASATIITGTAPARFPSVRVMVEADLRGWLPVMGVVLQEALIAQILDEAERALKPYVTADGTMAFDSVAHVIAATKPAALVY